MADFTRLEQEVLAAICAEQTQIAEHLGRLLATASVTERDNTGHGFFTSFEVERDQPLQWPTRHIDGPNLKVEVGQRVLLMGFVLWQEEGYPDCLEGFQYGT